MIAKLMEKLNIKSAKVMKALLFGVCFILAVFAAVYVYQIRSAPAVVLGVGDISGDAYIAYERNYEILNIPIVEVIMVYISGEVINPGVYEFYSGARIVDAVYAAGGFTEYADANAVNLAAHLTDAQHIVVFHVDDNMPPSVSAQAASGRTADGRININTATSEELQALSGVGPSIAGRIISHREARGGFSSVEDIMNVSGIGERIFENIRDSISVN